MYTQKNFVTVTTIQLIIFYINNHKVAFCNHPQLHVYHKQYGSPISYVS